jgi:hypothetical protein
MLGARPPAGPTPPHAHGRQNGGAKAKVLHGPAAAAAAAAASAPQGEALRQEQRDAVKRKKRQNCATLDEIALKVLPAEGICRRGLLLRLTEFILPPPHPSLKEMYPRVDISYDQIRIRMNIQMSRFEYCEKLSFHILLSTVAICANSKF